MKNYIKQLLVPNIPPLRRLKEQRDNLLAENSKLLAERDNLLAERDNQVKAILDQSSLELIERTLDLVRKEYTVMPRFGFHQPLDYYADTFPAQFDKPIWVSGDRLPLPPVPERMGYSADNQEYLDWGFDDKNHIEAQMSKYLGYAENVAILDFGCSSGRVLRHFFPYVGSKGWKLYGVDVQARPIQWMREHFPNDFCVYTGTTMPKLPFPDNQFDVIYGISVFTHIKFNWDMWLLELRRVLKPGGLLIQTIHGEHAWQEYYNNRELDWIRDNLPAAVLDRSEMPYDYFYYGDIGVSQVFWKREVARSYWSRYLDVLDILPPFDKRSFQDCLVCRKS